MVFLIDQKLRNPQDFAAFEPSNQCEKKILPPINYRKFFLPWKALFAMSRPLLVMTLLLCLGLPTLSWGTKDVPQKGSADANEAMSPAAQNALGVRFVTGEDVEQSYDKARSWWLRASKRGHAGAQYNLGQMFATGTGVDRNDVEAARWYQKAADQGDALAQFNLGLLYDSGSGVEVNPVKASELFRQAALHGLADAQNSLGRMYEMGRGVEQNIEEAKRWYRMAASQGHVFAQSNLGFQLYAGSTSPDDLIEAYAWLSLAAHKNNAIAKAHLAELTEKISKAQIKAGRSMATELGSSIAKRKNQKF